MGQEILNGSKTESSINTLAQESIEVPNSTGAKGVILEYLDLDLDPPQPVAATIVKSQGVAALGKSTLTGADYSQTGAIMARQHTLYNQAGAAVAEAIVASGNVPLTTRMFVPRASDGKYYLTFGVKGTDCPAGNTLTLRWAAKFNVVR
jgi:hypothetical protein